MSSLAWQLLKREKLRFFIGAMGVAFGVVLMFMQFGFQSALFDSAALMQSTLNGDIVLINPNTTSLVNIWHFTERRLYQALASKYVLSVSPLYVGYAACTSEYGEGTRRTFVLGFKPEQCVFRINGVEENRYKLHADDEVLFDELSRKEFGPLSERLRSGAQPTLKVSHHNVKIAGTFKLGTSFGADGNIITSDSTFFRMGFQKEREPGLIDIGLIRLKSSSDLAVAQAELKKVLASDVLVLTRAEFINLEKNYWRQTTAIGFIFSIGVVLGLVVGAIIVYQILYSDVNDHLAEYATLKAMGYSDTFLTDVVLQEAIILSSAGFLPGLAISGFLYALTRDVTGLPMSLNLQSELFVAALSIVMCCCSAMLAASRLRTADPVECF